MLFCSPGSSIIKLKPPPEFVIKKVGTYPFKKMDEPMNIYAIANAGFNIPTESQALAPASTKKIKHPEVFSNRLHDPYILFLFIAYCE